MNSKSKGLSETIQADKPQGKFKKSCICKSAKENIGIILDLKKGNPFFSRNFLLLVMGRVAKSQVQVGSGFENSASTYLKILWF